MNATTREILLEDKNAYNKQQRMFNLIDKIKIGEKIPGTEKREHKINSANRELLLSYNEEMEKQYLKKIISICGWLNSLDCSYQFAKMIDKSFKELNRKDIEKWFGFHEQRLMNRQISAWTLNKIQQQARKLLRFVLKLENSKQYIVFFDWTRKLCPTPPKNTVLASDLPSQKDIQELLITLRNQGNKTSILYSAIVSLANDSGARISEILNIRNKDVKEEQGYLVITLPESKTTPRTIVSILAKPFIQEWDRVSPNRGKPNELFFCNSKGGMLRYFALRKALNIALKETGLEFPRGKSLHFFRKIFASRSYDFPTIVRNYWLGWSSGISDVYTTLNYQITIPHYQKMLQKENNPMFNQLPSWENEALSEKMLENFLESEAGQMALKQWVKKMNKA